ncbi:DUF448 domain-containing protein [Sphingosinicella sp. LY1275]|uniref:DUF448 domain-containing protein n=1 Tax=Sphingosinicella sp. LY1275 TaxID=3095379 RepID=UPI003A1016A2
MRQTPNETLSEASDVGGRKPSHTPERKCILSGEHAARDALVRLAIGPDGTVLPDVRAKAPGRGAWIGVDRATLEAAQTKGRLRGALLRSFKGADLKIPEDLGARIADALRQAALDRLGLEARSGTLLTGSEKIETAARRGDVHLLIHAADASEDGNRKLDQAWRVGGGGEETGGQGLVFPAERSILSLALGRQNVVHVALIDRAAAARVSHALARWRAFIGVEGQLNPCGDDAAAQSALSENEGFK